MSAPDSEPPSMEENVAVQEEEGASPDVPLSTPPTYIPSSAPPFPTTVTPNFTVEAVMEGKAVSVACSECCSAVSSPAEASLAKPAETTACDDTVGTSTPTSHMASASDSLVCRVSSLFYVPVPPPSPSSLTLYESGGPDSENDHPRVLTLNGVSVTLENHSVWKKFHGYGTEMILTKSGRRMFPYCRYRLSGLDPDQIYSLMLSIVPWDQHRYRWNKNQWEVSGRAEHQLQGLIQMFPHEYSPCLGSKWMSNLVSFYRLKLTNNFQDRDVHIILNSMHRYIPRLHVIPVSGGKGLTADEAVVIGPESMTFTFPQTKFMAVTTYQNMLITQLKIYFNPFARGFREDGNNPRLQKISRDLDTVKEADATQAPDEKPDEITADEEKVMDLSMKSCSDSTTNVQETRLVPIMSNPASKDEPYTPCMQGRCSLGELVLVEKSPPVEQKDKDDDAPVGGTPEPQRDSEALTSPKARSETPLSCASTPETSPGSRKRKKKINRRWASFQARQRKASPAAAHKSLLNTSMQPETDDVEGLLFVSFTSKEALEVHIKDKPAANTPPATPRSPSTVMQSRETMEMKPETDGEKIARLESVLLNDLRVLKHRQVIHPVLQEVGLKLSSLDPAKSIDLQYLGVILPLPPPNRSEENLSARNKGLPFISRTGKTSDMTKIKGWKTKFMTSSEASSPNCEGLQRNLSAFCSNMLDEYLESEAQQITERAAAFSANTEGSVTYQLPAKSASYVKTLDSALAHRNAASKSPVKADRPCPLSHKPLLYSALTSPPPSLDRPKNTGKARAWFKYKSESSHTRPASESASAFSDSPQRSSYRSVLSRKPAVGWIHRRRMLPPRFFGLTKIQRRLLEMEMEASNQGLSRTHLTPDRQSMALSALVTKQTEPGRTSTVPLKKLSVGSNCDKAHCRLGCICPGEELLNGDQIHCRKPECMFDCSCSRSDSTEQTAEGGSEQHTNLVSSVTVVEHAVPPRPGSHTNTLWNRNIQDEDPEQLFTPQWSSSVLKCSQEPPETQPIQEHEKDPVYRYFESLMTCARVRGVGSRPPRQVLTQPQIDAIWGPNTGGTTQAKKAPDIQAENNHGTGPLLTNQEEKAAQRNPFIEKDAKKQIQIQSLCPWQKDRKVILEALCTRMSQNRLSKRFHAGPYSINPIDKICMRKPSGAVISYRLQIGVRSSDSDDDNDDDDEDEFAIGEEEQEDDYVEEPERFFGVTPFLSGVAPAGRMRVRRKSPACQQGLVQVNGKCYNHAKLMLGSVGSLHPANRLAAFVTGRLKVPKMLEKISQKTNSTHQPNTAKSLQIKAAGSVVSPVIPARRPSDLKTPTQPQGQSIQPNLSGKEPAASSQDSRVTSSVSSQQHFAVPLQSSSTSSPVSLTVSPSLKSPSFLEESGTYSFRICPPSNKSGGAQKLPGVSLPGGFTLIQLPKLGVKGAAAPQTAPPAAAVQAGPQPANTFSQLASAWLGSKTQDKIRSLLSSKSESGSSSEAVRAEAVRAEAVRAEAVRDETVRNETVPSDGGDGGDGGCAGEADRLAESHLSSPLEDLTSDSSDYSDCDEIEEPVDVETVEEDSQSKAIAQMRETAVKNLQASNSVEQPVNRQRKNHTVVERARRHEQRILFNKLATVLRCDPKAARLTLLGQALEEIQNLTRVSELLKKKKKTLASKQYVCLQKLSLLSGKSVVQIKNKLTEICARQKMEKASNVRFFSNLLQSRAAQLETAAAQSDPSPPQSDIPMIPAHENIRKMLFMLQPHLYKALTDSYGKAIVPEPPEPGEVLESFPVSVHRSKPEDEREPSREVPGDVTVAETIKWLRAQTADAPTPPSASSVKRDNNSPQQGSSVPVTLPLIRSKTGRIILPSCLKPLGNGYYTLMVMKSKDKGEAAAGALTDADQSRNPEETQTVSVERESSSVSGDKATSSDLNPKPPGTSNARSRPAVPIQSPPAPSKTPDTPPKNKALLTDADMNQILAATRLTFNQLPENVQIPVKRVVGRPAKRPAGTKAGRPPRPKPVKEQPKKTEKKAEADGGVAETPAPGKRRGRPLKRRSQELSGGPVKRGVGRPSKPKQDDPESFSHRFRSPQGGGGTPNASRPLTRGALGKDFPSAKKRSWIDVEKELESDVESE